MHEKHEPAFSESKCFKFIETIRNLSDSKSMFIKIQLFDKLLIKTSMMWPSQNFLLYNRTIIKIKAIE